MFANGQSLFVVATFIVANVFGQTNDIISLDDVIGSKYVNSDQVRAVKMEMMERGNGYGTDWIVMPDGNGNPEIAILSINWGDNNKSKSAMDRNFFTITSAPEDVVTFRLFTRSGVADGVVFDETTLDSLPFDELKTTKVIIHGWRSSADSATVTNIRDAYLDMMDVNVITVDWSEPASNIFYPAPAAYTKEVGKYVGRMIDQLVARKGGSYEKFHVVGHSLGAHTAGAAGHSTLGEISRITGLDPALPDFRDVPRQDRLDDSDAAFVDVIHTCSGKLGMSAPIGHADFYPNGGSPFQPGCCCITEVMGVCSHGRSHQYFTESITSKTAFEGIKCNSWKEFTDDSCVDIVVPMGEFTPSTTRGAFYLETNSESPFGLGMEGTKCTQCE